MTELPIIDQLAAHRTVGVVPREQLEWLARVGQLATFEAGENLTTMGEPVRGLFIVLDGHLSIRVDRGTGSRIVMEWHGGDVTGLLPYSRIKSPPGSVVAERRTVVWMLEPPAIEQMIREWHELTAVMVHVMLDRARAFKSSELLDEKMASLGRLAAGLAHELNNPASAVARSAKTLLTELEKLDDVTKQFCQLNLSDAQCLSIASLRNDRVAAPQGRSPMQVADREDALADWLEGRGIDGVPLEPLAASSIEPRDLEALNDVVGVDRMSTVLSHIAAGQVVRRLASEIHMAASRIHHLVDAVKGFTYMDQQSTLQPIAISRGLSDTVTVLGSKARNKGVTVHLDIAPNLPDVDGYGGELNQVWGNLLDNAIDASPKGHVHITAGAEHGKVVVRVIDDGPGILPAVLNRIFDPFFTTKPVGEGTGLGLDIAMRLVHRHQGTLDVTTDELGTTFRVTLPTSQSNANTQQ